MKGRDALIGTWVEEDDHFGPTPVVFRITIRDGRVFVSAVDHSDGTRLRISGTNWDGLILRFVSFYPPTQWRAVHDFQVAANGHAEVRVSYTDEYGEHCINENWKKVKR